MPADTTPESKHQLTHPGDVNTNGGRLLFPGGGGTQPGNPGLLAVTLVDLRSAVNLWRVNPEAEPWAGQGLWVQWQLTDAAVTGVDPGLRRITQNRPEFRSWYQHELATWV